MFFVLSPKVAVKDGGEARYDPGSGFCVVLIADSPAGTKDNDLLADMKYLVAHELAHCVQYWTVGKKVYGGGLLNASTWWVEGTAEYMATNVYSGGPRFHVWTKGYDLHSQYSALTQMTYETYVFFCWLAQENGKAGIFDFMRKVTDTGGQPGMRASVANIVGADKLQKFAQDYVDGAIKGAKGETIGNAEMFHTLKVDDDKEELFIGQQFAVLRGNVDFSGGDYEVSAGSGEKPDAMWSLNNGPWKAMDKIVKSSCSHPAHYRYVAFQIAHNPMHLTLHATLTAAQKSCAPCSDLPQQAVCLVGTWKVDNDMLRQVFNAHTSDILITKKTEITGTTTLEFRKDGTAIINQPMYVVDASMKERPISLEIRAHGTETGHWSSKDATMRICPAHSDIKIDTKTTIYMNGTPMVSNVTVSGGTDKLEMVFTCNGANMTLYNPNATLNGEHPHWAAHRIK